MKSITGTNPEVTQEVPEESTDKQRFDPSKFLEETSQPKEAGKGKATGRLALAEAILLFCSAIASGGSFPRLVGIYAAANVALAIVRLLRMTLKNENKTSDNANPAVGRLKSGLIFATGVIVPSMIAIAYGVYHLPGTLGANPFGTANEIAIVLAIPFSICTSWFIITRKRWAHATLAGTTTGIALGVTAALATTWVFQPPLGENWGSDNTLGLLVLWAPAAFLGASLLLTALLSVQHAKFRRIGSYSALAGIAASGLLTVAPHINEYATDLKVATTTGGAGEQRQQAIDYLKSNLTASQLALLFAEPKQGNRYGFGRVRLFERADLQAEPYFLLTGKSLNSLYSPSDTTAYDAQLGKQVVGTPISGLTMTRSNLEGSLNPDSLTGSFDWTMAFRNASKSAVETRSEIQLPAGAVVSRVTAWINGKPVEATFDRTDKTTNAYQWVVQRHRDPILVTSAGQDRIFVQAYPVPPYGGNLKLRLGIKTPLALSASGRCNVALPRIANKNFAPKAREAVNLSATGAFIPLPWSTTDLLADQKHHLRGLLPLAKKGDEPTSISLEHPRNLNLVATLDPTSHGRDYIVQRVLAQTNIPVQKVVFVIDTSSALKECTNSIKKTLNNLASDKRASVIFASLPPGKGSEKPDNDTGEMLPEYSIREALKEMDRIAFTGGTNDDTAVLQALESAATVPGGTVVWLHGPQPLPPAFTDLESLGIFNKPRLVDLQLGTGNNELIDAWHNNHFNSIASYDHVAVDDLAPNLDSVLNSYVSGQRSALVTQELVHKKPDLPISDSPLLAAELSSLWASKAVSGLIEAGENERAEQIGAQYNIVSPLTAAVALEKASDYSFNGLQQSQFKAAQPTAIPNIGQIAASGTNAVAVANPGGSSPSLAGATNGTIGPQGSDATVVEGVNTSGTVRVNNLANFEAAVNIATNLLEISGFIYAAVALCIAATSSKIEKSTRLSIRAIAVLTIAMMIPGAVNWLIASARDANLFS
jgi:hypothetical protein